MPLDALCLSGVVHELQNALSGAKIDKIYQPGRDEVVLALRAPAGNVKLLLSANPSHPRAHLTQISRENPDKPPMFCMLLRKHLSGARLLELVQPPMERVVDLRLEALDELGDRVERRLVLEAMGRHSNLILLDGEGRIMDCLRRVDSDMSARRQVLPGLFYRLPPAQEKLDPSSLDRAALEFRPAPPHRRRARRTSGCWTPSAASPPSSAVSWLSGRGEPPTRGCIRWGKGAGSRLLDELEGLLRSVQENRFHTCHAGIGGAALRLYLSAHQPVRRPPSPVSTFPSFSALLDRFYEQRESQERVRQRGQDLIRSVTNARDRAARKIGLQEQELAATRDRERLRQFGDIITSNLHAMEKGMSRLTAADFYDPECPQIHIPLDPLLTPQQNAAKYYKEYNKAKTAEKYFDFTARERPAGPGLPRTACWRPSLWRRESGTSRRSARSSPTPDISAAPPKPETGASGWPRSPWSSAPPPACVSPWAKTTPRTTCSLPSRLSRATCGSTPRRSTAPTSSCGPRGDSPT